MLTSQTPQPRQALQEVSSNTAKDMEVDSSAQGHCKTSQTTLKRPKGENQPLSLLSPDPSLSDFALQQALLHSPQFDGSPNTIFKLKLAHLGFVEGSPPGGKMSQQAKVCHATCTSYLLQDPAPQGAHTHHRILLSGTAAFLESFAHCQRFDKERALRGLAGHQASTTQDNSARCMLGKWF